MTFRQTFYVTLITAAALLPSVAMAGAVSVPSVAEPDRVRDRLHVIERPELNGEPLITLSDEGGKPLKSNVQFVLREIQIEGLTAVPASELKSTYESFIGEKVSLNTLQTITRGMTAYLRNEGYVLSRAVLPPQRINKSGVVKIRVVEGFADNVSVQGPNAENALIQNYVNKIRNSKPLNSKSLERYLLLMEDLPGSEARAVIQPSATKPGASDVIIALAEKKYEGSLTADNRGSRFLGPYQGSATVDFNNIFGWFERTRVRILSTLGEKELRFGEIVHEQQVGTEGTSVAVSASHTATDPGLGLEPLDVEGQSRTYSAAVKHPLLRSRQENIYGIAEFTVRDTDVTALDDRLYEDRTRVLKLTASHDFIDRFNAVNKVDFSASKGFGAFNDDAAAGLRSRADGKTSFFKLNVDASHLHTISGPFAVYVAASGQWSADPLLASEEFALGGPDFGTAYDPSELTGDHGAAGKIELQYNGFTDMAWMSNYQFYGYYDLGKVWNKGNIATDDSESLASTGLGVRFNLWEDFSGDLQVALPLNHTVAANGEDGRAPRAFFSVAYRF